MLSSIVSEFVCSFTANIKFYGMVEYYCIMLPLLLIMQVIFTHYDKSKTLKRPRYIFGIQVFCMICIGILVTTGVPNIKYVLTHAPDVGPDKLYLNPLRFFKYDFASYILNVILFIPFGFMFGLLKPNSTNMIFKIAVYGAVFSLCIELLQLFNSRTTDIDDVITNCIGSIIGYKIASFMLRKSPVYVPNNTNFIVRYIWEIYIIVIVLLWLLLPF